MSGADELLRLMFSWIRQRESCAEQMKKLAKELETIRERCNVAECCGDMLSVVGAGGLIAAGVVTLFTGGAAAPLLGVLAAACGGAGATVSVGTKLTELFLSSNTLEELQEADEMSNELAEKIEKQFERLKKEVRRTNPSADPEELDQHVMDQFMRAVARRGGIRMDNISTDSLFKVLKVVGFPMTGSIEGMFVGILRSVGRQLVNKAAKEVAKKAASAGFKAAVKGAGKVAGGAVGMAFALPEAIDNWTDLIKNNHVTEASQSLRDNAKKLLETSQELKTQLNNMRKKCEEVVKRQRDYEATKRRQTDATDKRQKKANQQTKQTRGDSRGDGGGQREYFIPLRWERDKGGEEVSILEEEESDIRQKKANQQTKQTRGDSRGDGGAQREYFIPLRWERDKGGEEVSILEEEESDIKQKKENQQTKMATQRTNTDQYQKACSVFFLLLGAFCLLCNRTAESNWKLGRDSGEDMQQRTKGGTEPGSLHPWAPAQPAEQTGHLSSSIMRATDNRQNEENQQTEQTGGDGRGDGEAQQGDDRSDDEHEESSQEEEESDGEEEESDSEEETEEDESEQTGRRKKLKRSQKTTSRRTNTNPDQRQTSGRVNNQESETQQIPPGFISMALLNVRSINTVTDTVRRLITGNQLDVFLTTETWLRPDTAERVLTEASPENYRNHYQVREGRRGGGVAIQFREELQGQRVWSDNIRTFEYVAAVLRRDDWDQPILIINLYLPPGYDSREFREFLDEFEELMKQATKEYSSIIVTGDFNIKVDPKRRSYTDEFYYLLPLYNLIQHVDEPTHGGGNILDLVLTRNVEISKPWVDPNAGINTDHYPIYFNAKPKPAETSEETEEDEDEEQGKQPKRQQG